jgi:hypothetical protein
MTKLFTKILLQQNVGTIVRLLITLKKYFILNILAIGFFKKCNILLHFGIVFNFLTKKVYILFFLYTI